jgi:hypothetical protein
VKVRPRKSWAVAHILFTGIVIASEEKAMICFWMAAILTDARDRPGHESNCAPTGDHLYSNKQCYSDRNSDIVKYAEGCDVSDHSPHRLPYRMFL